VSEEYDFAGCFRRALSVKYDMIALDDVSTMYHTFVSWPKDRYECQVNYTLQHPDTWVFL
jgi:hypothetical protein